MITHSTFNNFQCKIYIKVRYNQSNNRTTCSTIAIRRNRVHPLCCCSCCCRLEKPPKQSVAQRPSHTPQTLPSCRAQHSLMHKFMRKLFIVAEFNLHTSIERASSDCVHGISTLVLVQHAYRVICYIPNR